jgi:hypothetical protein
MTIYKMLTQIGKVSGAVSLIFAALAGAYAVWEYYQAKDAVRIEESLGLFKVYNAEPFTTYRKKISKALIANNDQLIKAAMIDERAYDAAQQKMILKEDIGPELLLVFNFFDGVATCVQNHVCDDGTTVMLFQARARDIFVYFYQFMMLKRTEEASDFGAGLEVIAKSGAPLQLPSIKQ